MSRYTDEENPKLSELENGDCTYDEFEAAREGYLAAEKEYALTEGEKIFFRAMCSFFSEKKPGVVASIKKKVLGD